MSLPEGSGGKHIDSSELLREPSPVIGTGEWNNHQCSYFKDVIQINDIICVKDGKAPIALCKVTSDCFKNPSLEAKYLHENFRQVEILEFYNGALDFPQHRGTLQIAKDENTDTWRFINNWLVSIKNKKAMEWIMKILKKKKQLILQGPPGTGKTYTAKDIAELLITNNISNDKKTQKKLLDGSGQFVLIQFHPAYTYEDFVRSLTAKSIDGQIEYVTENRIIADFADKANKNLIAYRKDELELSLEKKIEQLIAEFAEYVQDKIDQDDEYKITDKVSIIGVEADAFRYKGDWIVGQRMKFKDLVKAQLSGVSSRQEFKLVKDISGLAVHHASYFFKVLTIFQELYREALESNETPDAEKPQLKNFVLIIDEINRANLPAVLGELIYALEYRGESVNSMYSIDSDPTIIIPENLYIIGTMNTADRSVGHIDYAIRRRFAFEKLLPNIDIIETDKGKQYFRVTEDLFNNDNLSSDYKNSKDDVQIGHSYFMGDEGHLALRMKYEVIPILREYLKDGIFREETRDKIDQFESLVSALF